MLRLILLRHLRGRLSWSNRLRLGAASLCVLIQQLQGVGHVDDLLALGILADVEGQLVDVVLLVVEDAPVLPLGGMVGLSGFAGGDEGVGRANTHGDIGGLLGPLGVLHVPAPGLAGLLRLIGGLGIIGLLALAGLFRKDRLDIIGIDLVLCVLGDLGVAGILGVLSVLGILDVLGILGNLSVLGILDVLRILGFVGAGILGVLGIVRIVRVHDQELHRHVPVFLRRVPVLRDLAGEGNALEHADAHRQGDEHGEQTLAGMPACFHRFHNIVCLSLQNIARTQRNPVTDRA